MRMLDVAIIGAGLSGLSLAEKLQASKPNLAVFEARERCGGRIQSETISELDISVDLGPTWLWPADQPRMAALTQKLGLMLYPQWDRRDTLYQVAADVAAVSYVDRQTHSDARRIHGGCHQLIDGLLQRLQSGVLYLGHRLHKIIDRGSHVELVFATNSTLISYQARQVVLAVPPRLLAASVSFEPKLAQPLLKLMQDTPTWMAGHAKAVSVYPEAFWRKHGFSGNAQAPFPSAILAEIYDACPLSDGAGSLFGFFGLPPDLRKQYQDSLPALITRQLVGLFGSAAANPVRVLIQDWSQEPFTATPLDHAPLFQHPEYGHRALQLDHWQDKLHFCGSETASRSGGYMEGALEASDRVLAALTL